MTDYTALREFVFGTSIRESPILMTREVSIVRLNGRDHLLCFRYECLLQMLIACVLWHDWPEGCPTWTGGSPHDDGRCCCDVEGVR